MFKKIATLTLFFISNLNPVTAMFYLKNKTKFDLGLYIDSSTITMENSEEKDGQLLYCIIEPER